MEGLPQNNVPIAEKAPIKKGVEYVFEQNHELTSIGTREDYSAYLETVFPESLFKDIVYHGTASKGKIEKFDFSKSNFARAVFFTDDLNFAHQFAFDDARSGSIQEQLLNITNPFDYTNSEHIEELREMIKQLVSEGYESPTLKFHSKLKSVYDGEKLVENPSIDDLVEHYMWRLRNGSWRIVETDRIVDFISKKYDSIKITEKGCNNIAVFSADQIHVLGSRSDVERFKKFLQGDL